MTNPYKIRLVPEDGPTIQARTEREYILGQTFKVIWSDAPCFRTGSIVVEQDIHDQEQHNGVKYDITFETLTKIEVLQQQADTDWVSDRALQLLEDTAMLDGPMADGLKSWMGGQ